MRRTRKLALYPLEDRSLPATFGIPWLQPRELTLSFAPDQTQISTSKSALFQTLNAQFSTLTWQTEILKAAQSWASAANIDIGLVNDAGLEFGANSGSGTGRNAGDIRIGAVAMPATSLAVGLPPDPFFGDVWSGDVIFNSTNALNPAQTNLFTVFTHELGHALGLPSSTNPASVMYNFATTPFTELSTSDVLAIQQLYGTRQQDAHDATEDNGTRSKASPIEPGHNSGSTTFTGQYPLVEFGDITTNADVDWYKVNNLKTYSGPITWTLRSRGLSLLAPQLSVYNEDGVLIASSMNAENGGGTVTIQISQANPDKEYFLKVEGATANNFGIGRYSVATTFNDLVNPTYFSRLDAVMTGPFAQLNEDDTTELFLDPTHAQFNDDQGGDDSISTAGSLTGPAMSTKMLGAIESAVDVDTYRIHIPSGTSLTAATVSVRAATTNGILPAFAVVNSAGQPLAATILYSGSDRTTIQVGNLTPGTDCFVRVSGASPTQIGNYELTTLVNPTQVTPRTLVSGTVGTAMRQWSLTVVQNAVFHFMLSINSPETSGVRLTIDDEMGQHVYDLTVVGNSTRNNRPVFLKSGRYVVNIERIGATGPTAPSVSFALRSAVLSDPITPAAQDTTQNPAGPNAGLNSYYLRALAALRDYLQNQYQQPVSGVALVS